ncbi:hypothetical protein ABEF79_08790 [Acinetobacter sp. ANC 7454]|uniref:hypothetical protein n=1 Tax=Acinetobacter thermotolerans TaxID=3151487 RepID=UPI00325ACB50
MDIEKLKAEFEQSECFKRLEHVAQYTFFEFGAYIKRTDVPADIEKKCGKLITALLFSWEAWREAKAQAVPAQLDVNSILHDIDYYFDNGLSNTERTANNLLQSIYEKLSGEVKAQEPAND